MQLLFTNNDGEALQPVEEGSINHFPAQTPPDVRMEYLLKAQGGSYHDDNNRNNLTKCLSNVFH